MIDRYASAQTIPLIVNDSLDFFLLKRSIFKPRLVLQIHRTDVVIMTVLCPSIVVTLRVSLSRPVVEITSGYGKTQGTDCPKQKFLSASDLRILWQFRRMIERFRLTPVERTQLQILIFRELNIRF